MFSPSNIILGDYAFFKENVAKPVTKSFLEKKKIHQYRIEQQKKEEEFIEEEKEREEKKVKVESAKESFSSVLSVLPASISPTTLHKNPPITLTGDDDVSTSAIVRADDPKEEATPSGDVDGGGSGSGSGGGSGSGSGTGSGISRSKFLSAIELSAEGISVLKKLHGQVRTVQIIPYQYLTAL